MRRILLLLLSCVLFSFNVLPQAFQKVTTRSLWAPGMTAIQEIRDQCVKASGEPPGDCLYAMMQNGGATLEALAFTRQTSNLGYLRDLLDLGPVAVAFVHFPFRANENQGAYIVNGIPAMIDIDQTSLLAQDELQRNLTYGLIAQGAPQVSIWPGDRSGTTFVVTKRLPMGGVRVTVPYVLRNGCRACDTLGTATFAFDFERSGRFLGTKLIGVTAQKKPLTPVKPQ
jgi:hypothetical protein